MSSRFRLAGGVAMAALLGNATAAELAAPGFRPSAPGVHALIGARVFTKPGSELTRATVIIRDGWIAEVGPEVHVPAEARVWDLSGHTVYAGFLDPLVEWSASSGNAPAGGNAESTSAGGDLTAGGHRFFGVAGQERDPGLPGAGYAGAGIVPERRLAATFTPDPKLNESLRELGFTAANLVPAGGIVRGQSVLVTLGDRSPNEEILKPDVAQHVGFGGGVGGDAFPNSLMGTIAAVRQAFYDARFQAADLADYAARPAGRTRPSFDTSLAALRAPLDATNRQPVVFEPGSVLMVERAALVARELGLDFQLVASGQEWRRPSVIRGAGTAFIVPIAFPALPKLPDDAAWDQVSLDQLRQWDWAPENPALLRQQGAEIALTTHQLGDRKEFRKNLRAALDRGLSETDALAALTLVPARLCGVAGLLGSIEPGKIANLTVCDARGFFDPEGKVRAVWIDGRVFEFPAAPAKPVVARATGSEKPGVDSAKEPSKESAPEKADAGGKDEKASKDDKATAERKAAEQRELARKRVAKAPLEGRIPPAAPPAVLVRSATVWTSGDRGILTNATVFAVNGRIRSVGEPPAGTVPEGTVVIDLPGVHVTPGIIDCHNHSMILGSVNETGLPSTAMVRVSDVVNAEAETIHQQLAGGLTVANLLHGSANPIGGQNCVIKLRDGAGPEELKFRNAPPGIKFALGENVKQSGWGDRFTTRFPQTRMGVPTFYRNRFTAARQYQEALKQAAAGGRPVRRNLELEALAEIIDGQRLIHCHSYRQDEILVFLRTMESFGVRVASLQHVLEGYKVADEIARHGAGASAFADWWSYKFEVIDAIPYAGSLMRERGVVVSFNSDSSDHARRLNFEAAKAVKYGGTPEAEALQFVTLNPARQLGIAQWVGSLEPDKDADFVVWSGSPLDSGSVCLQTWIEGRKYFDRGQEPARVSGLTSEREALISKARKLAGAPADAPASEKARGAFFARAWEQATHLGVSQCQDCTLPRRP